MWKIIEIFGIHEKSIQQKFILDNPRCCGIKSDSRQRRQDVWKNAGRQQNPWLQMEQCHPIPRIHKIRDELHSEERTLQVLEIDVQTLPGYWWL